MRDGDLPAVNGMDTAEKPRGWRGAWRLVKTSLTEWWQDDTFRYSASLAFYTIFSVAPVLLIAVGAASLFFARDIATEKIVAEVQRMVGSQGAQAVRQVMDASTGFGKSIWAITSGVVTFLLGATAVFAELQSALNKIWDVQAKPRRGLLLSFVFDRLRSFTIALAVGFLLLVSLVISAALTVMQDYLNNWMPGVPVLWQLLNIGASFFIAALLFAMIYKYLPDVEITWKDVWIGAVVTRRAFHDRQIPDRFVYRANRGCECVRRRRLLRGAPDLDLLLSTRELLRRGVHPSLRAALRLEDQTQQPRCSGRRKIRYCSGVTYQWRWR